MFIDENWDYYKIDSSGNNVFLGNISLPHDAMIHEQRRNENRSGKNCAYFDGGEYLYIKKLNFNNSSLKKAYLVFEGIYQKATIYLNNKEIGKCDYGYVDTIIEISKYIKEGENTLSVKANNLHQPNSRWYSGSGIFRHVNLYILPDEHVIFNSLKIKTLDYRKKLINITYQLTSSKESKLEIIDTNGLVIKTIFSSTKNVSLNVEVPEINLWSIDSPNLYTFKVTFCSYSLEVKSGIRSLVLSKNEGLLINGQKNLLKGCCIHHDNGLLGAEENDFAAYRKIKLLKNVGFNAIRSAHNPCSRAILDACDQLGMLVIDEYADAWYIHKTKYDLADHVLNYWKEDLKKIVDKDYNHPSVIMYSTGNEVAETSQKKGIMLVKEFNKYLHELDETRFTTCGINVFFNALYSVGLGQYSDKKADAEVNQKKKKSSGSEFFNNLAGLLGAEFMKTMAKLHLVDLKTKDAFNNMDVAGYNYGIKRYHHDFKKYPNRFIVGSETFCSDEGKFMAEANKYPRLLGDFVWAGIDYLGECGLGSLLNKDKIKIDEDKNWLIADTGVIDILGDENSQSDYVKVAYRKEPVKLGIVSPYDYRSKHTPSSWRFTRAMHSYSFNGEENNTTICEVYFNSPSVEIYQNDKLLKTFSLNDSCCKKFKIKYIPGSIKAIAKDKQGNILGQDILYSASNTNKLITFAEQTSIKNNELGYIHINICDENNILKPLNDTSIKIDSIENGKLIAFSSACPYNKELFFSNKTTTYNGKCLLIVKPISSQPIKVKFSSIYGSSETIINIA